jgi:hypothetical protein
MRPLLGLHPLRQQQLTERRILQQARGVQGAVQREIARAMSQLGESAGDPGLSAQVLATHKAALTRILDRHYRGVMPVFGLPVLEAVADMQKALPQEASFRDRMMAWIAVRGAQEVTAIANTTMDQAQRIINRVTSDALIEGLGQQETARALQAAIRQEGGALSRSRAGVIARTETHNAAMSAQHMAAEESGFPMRKVWSAARGERTRDDHADADGQTRRLDEPFLVGGEELMYPGDPSGSPEQTINCRCVETFIVD